ncbi:MAG: amidohydrolase family protein, partial [Pseudomonadota bacterium]
SAGVKLIQMIEERRSEEPVTLQYASTFGATVSMTPHDHWLLGNGTVHEGEVSTRLGLPAIPEAAETVGVARDIALIETTGVRAHFDLLSCGRSAKMVHEAQRRKLPLTAGVAIHQLLLDERAVGEFDTMCKTYPPLRTAEDKKQLRSALKRGVISCICSDHKPHGKDAKLAPFSEAASGISGLDSFMSLAWSLVADGVIDRMQLVSVVSSNPASLIGSPAGNLGAGSPADIIVFDPDRKWTLNSKSMLSRGKNSPFLDSYRCGKVTKTWVAGKLVFEDESH